MLGDSFRRVRFAPLGGAGNVYSLLWSSIKNLSLSERIVMVLIGKICSRPMLYSQA